jgi:hypothetical protein
MSASTNPNQNNLLAMTSPPQNPGPTAGAIPDLMKIGTIPVNTVQEVETAILDPVVKSDTFCRFVLDNKGLLHSHSKIEIGLKNATEDSFLPLSAGVYGFIKRVALKIGNQTICEIDEFNHYASYRSMFVSNENQKEREQMTTGRCISHKVAYTDRTDASKKSPANVITGGGEDDTGSNGIVIDNGREADVEGAYVDDTAQYYPNTWQMTKVPSNFDATKDINLYQIAISELCPFLRHNQLPLYMIKEQVALELHFSAVGDSEISSHRASVKSGESTAGAFPIDLTTIRMISDHIFYPQELMIQYANANKVLNFTYADYRLSQFHRSNTDAAVDNIRNIGGAGRIVNKLIWQMNDQDTNNSYVLNGYNSFCPKKDYTNADVSKRENGTTTLNIKYNDTFEFPIDVKNNARHFHNLNQAEGMVPFVNRDEYSNEGDATSSRTWWGKALNGQLPGFFFYHAQRLTAQERINSRGIELYFKYDTLPTNVHGYIQRVWLEIMRTATIQNGYTECYFA